MLLKVVKEARTGISCCSSFTWAARYNLRSETVAKNDFSRAVLGSFIPHLGVFCLSRDPIIRSSRRVTCKSILIDRFRTIVVDDVSFLDRTVLVHDLESCRGNVHVTSFSIVWDELAESLKDLETGEKILEIGLGDVAVTEIELELTHAFECCFFVGRGVF